MILGIISLVVAVGALVAVFVVKAQIKKELKNYVTREELPSDGRKLYGEKFYSANDSG